jgi:peroxiredoxin
MLAVSVDSAKSGVESFAEKSKYTFPILFDSGSKVTQMYKVSGIPATYIINKKGIIVDKIVGSRDWSSEENVERFQDLMNE